jgi:hypothetical protein
VLAATWFTAVATGLLAIFAVITTFVAARAFRKQSTELELQRIQLEEQRVVNSKQIKALDLQSLDLNESLAERKREASERRRDQAERIDVTWTNTNQDPDDPDWPDKSTVIVINGSRRPIRRVTCVLIDTGKTPTIQINTLDCAELIQDPEVDSFTFPKGFRRQWTDISTLRGGGRGGFKFPTKAINHPFKFALVEFTDDTGNRWSLTSRLQLRLLDDPPVSVTDAEKGELANVRETE